MSTEGWACQGDPLPLGLPLEIPTLTLSEQGLDWRLITEIARAYELKHSGPCRAASPKGKFPYRCSCDFIDRVKVACFKWT